MTQNSLYLKLRRLFIRQERLNYQLAGALVKRDLDGIERLLRKWASLANLDLDFALAFMVSRGDFRLVEWIMKKHPQIKPDFAISRAIRENNRPMLDFLLLQGAP